MSSRARCRPPEDRARPGTAGALARHGQRMAHIHAGGFRLVQKLAAGQVHPDGGDERDFDAQPGEILRHVPRHATGDIPTLPGPTIAGGGRSAGVLSGPSPNGRCDNAAGSAWCLTCVQVSRWRGIAVGRSPLRPRKSGPDCSPRPFKPQSGVLAGSGQDRRRRLPAARRAIALATPGVTL